MLKSQAILLQVVWVERSRLQQGRQLGVKVWKMKGKLDKIRLLKLELW